MSAVIQPSPGVRLLSGSDVARWDDYVETASGATFYHRAGWRDVIERAFGHSTYFLYSGDEDTVTGVLPLVHVKSWLFGNSLVSTSFCMHGGVVADSVDIAAGLEAAARALAEDLGVDYLEFRGRPASAATDWQEKDLYVNFRKSISNDSDENLKAVPRKQRAMIRKGIKAGLEGVINDEVDRFYLAYSESVRNLGTPVFPRRYFRLLKEVFSEDCEILSVEKDGQLVCAAMSFYFRDQVLPLYGGGGVLARQYKGNDFLYWSVMCQAVSRGAEIFDFGRSKRGTGSYSFKKNWGFEPEPLPYFYRLVKGRALPDINPLNPKYRLMIETWKRLPLGLSRMLGPRVSRYLG